MEDVETQESSDTTIEEILKSRLTKDLKDAAKLMSAEEARFLVDAYYQMQDNRIHGDNQVRAMLKVGEPNAVLRWFAKNAAFLEAQVKRALGSYAEGRRDGRWLLSVHGIGPVLAAGFLAHINIERCNTAGKLWRFAGLDPTVKWEKGQKRPWNARLKVLCWKAGESFKKFSNSDECFYGHIYRERKALEVSRNESGLFVAQAQASLAEKNWKRDTVTKAAYESGKLPPARLDLRATRYAVKMLLSHLQHVMWEVAFNEKPPKPWVIEHGGHTNIVAPPGWPCE